jgi:hypothetical protein
MTVIRLRTSNAATALAAHLQGQHDVSVDRLSDDQLRVIMLGSYSTEAMRLAIHLRVRAWAAAERAQGRAVAVELDEE